MENQYYNKIYELMRHVHNKSTIKPEIVCETSSFLISIFSMFSSVLKKDICYATRKTAIYEDSRK